MSILSVQDCIDDCELKFAIGADLAEAIQAEMENESEKCRGKRRGGELGSNNSGYEQFLIPV